MRKTCNHPYLIEYPLTEDGNFYRSDEDMVDVCGKLKVLDQMLTELFARQHKVLIFSQMTKLLDILADYMNLRYTKFLTLLTLGQTIKYNFIACKTDHTVLHWFHSGRGNFLV